LKEDKVRKMGTGGKEDTVEKKKSKEDEIDPSFEVAFDDCNTKKFIGRYRYI
jgi:hypothetical protein